MKRISWANYKMNQSTDKIGVFVSVVSTKIPYKGAGKEYIGAPFTFTCGCTIFALQIQVPQGLVDSLQLYRARLVQT